jgi:transposase
VGHGQVAKNEDSAQEKLRLVLSMLAGDITATEAARRCGVSANLVKKWKHP